MPDRRARRQREYVRLLPAYASSANLTVDPAQLPDDWWRVPVLIAAQNAVLEEVIVLGYLTRRPEQLGWSSRRSTTASAVLRGSYHPYQGLGGFAGNVVMGVLFCHLYRRWGRVMPLVVAHTLIDVVALVGATYLIGRADWLPGWAAGMSNRFAALLMGGSSAYLAYIRVPNPVWSKPPLVDP